MAAVVQLLIVGKRRYRFVKGRKVTRLPKRVLAVLDEGMGEMVFVPCRGGAIPYGITKMSARAFRRNFPRYAKELAREMRQAL